MLHFLECVCRCYIVLSLSAFLLISIGQVCNAVYAVLFLTNIVSIGYKSSVVIQGARAHATGLYNPSPLCGLPPITMTLLLPSNRRMQEVLRLSLLIKKPTASAAILQLHIYLAAIGSDTPQALLAFSHAALFSPALSTLVTSLTKGFLPQLRGLTLATLYNPSLHLVATIKVPLYQICKNFKFTKATKPLNVPDPAEANDHHTKCFHNSEIDKLTLYKGAIFIHL
jgi:hypothetical protein